MIRLIAAIDRNNGLAKKGVMPWNIPDDEHFFTDMTKKFGGNVLSGGKTFRTYSGPLKDRKNFVLTHNTDPIDGAVVVNELSEFLDGFEDDLWIAGGGVVFEEVMKLGKADELYLTHIDADFGCNVFFPPYANFVMTEQSEPKEQNGFRFIYATYRPR